MFTRVLAQLTYSLTAYSKYLLLHRQMSQVYCRFEGIIERVLQHCIEHGEIRDKDTKTLAMFVVAGIEGSMATAKKSQNPELFHASMIHLRRYLNSFRILAKIEE